MNYVPRQLLKLLKIRVLTGFHYHQQTALPWSYIVCAVVFKWTVSGLSRAELYALNPGYRQ